MSSGPDPERAAVTVEVTRDDIRRFAAATGISAQVHHDIEAARRAGYRDLLAPHYFVVTLGLAMDVPYDRSRLTDGGLARSDPLAGSRVRAGETALEWFGPVIAGDRITVSPRTLDVHEKHGRSGTLRVHHFVREYHRADELLVRERYARIAL